jgi:TonB family protein
MFDRLVESRNSRYERRTGRYFILIMAFYSVAMAGIGIGTIIGFSPVLAEEYLLSTRLAPPPPPAGPPQRMLRSLQRSTAPSNIIQGFLSPKRVIDIPDPSKALDYSVRHTGIYVPGAPSGIPGNDEYVPGGKSGGDPLPPPVPRPQSKPEPPPVIAIKPGSNYKVSEGVLQGRAIKRVIPGYSFMARQIRASGNVQVLVTISEEGMVIEAAPLNGHPLLRSSAVEAARQWVFSPTTLGNVPVKVQGVLTFNFVLQ